MKKSIFVLLAAAAIGFTACGGGGTPPPSGNNGNNGGNDQDDLIPAGTVSLSFSGPFTNIVIPAGKPITIQFPALTQTKRDIYIAKTITAMNSVNEAAGNSTNDKNRINTVLARGLIIIVEEGNTIIACIPIDWRTLKFQTVYLDIIEPGYLGNNIIDGICDDLYTMTAILNKSKSKVQIVKTLEQKLIEDIVASQKGKQAFKSTTLLKNSITYVKNQPASVIF